MSFQKFQKQIKKIHLGKRKFLLDKLMAYNISKKKEKATSDLPEAMIPAIEKTDKALADFILVADSFLHEGLSLPGAKLALTKNNKKPEEIISSRRGKYYQAVAEHYESVLTNPQRQEFTKEALTYKAETPAPVFKTFLSR